MFLMLRDILDDMKSHILAEGLVGDAREGTGITTAGAGSVLGSRPEPGPRWCCQYSSPAPQKWPLDSHSTLTQ